MDIAQASYRRTASHEDICSELHPIPFSGLVIEMNSNEEPGPIAVELGNKNGNDEVTTRKSSQPERNLPESSSANSTLHQEVLKNNSELVALLLRNGANVDQKDRKGNTPLLLAGTNLSSNDHASIVEYEKVVSILIGYGANVNAEGSDAKQDLNTLTFTVYLPNWESVKKRVTTALDTAIFLKSLKVVELLVQNEVNTLKRNSSGYTPIHAAASNNSEGILKAMLSPHLKDKAKLIQHVNVRDSNGCTPLHYAAAVGSHECVECLVKYGANMCLMDNSGVSALEAVLRQVPRPKKFLLALFDSCISGSKNIPVGKRGYKVLLDFYILCPQGCKTQTDFLSTLFTAESLPTARCRAIFKHPLLEAFICYKWHKLRFYFLGLFLINLAFVATLSAFVCVQFYFREIDDSLAIGALRYLNMVCSALVLAMNVGQYAVRFKYYARQYESWAVGLSALLSMIWTIASVFEYPGAYSGVVMHMWMRHVISVQLPLAWGGLMLLLGRFPIWGARALLFGMVLKNVLLTFFVLGFIIIGFSFAFFVQFHDVSPEGFGDPWKSFANTVVMMTGEYGYLDIFGMDSSLQILPFTSRFIFLCFVLVVTVVLMNLIIGLAVADTQVLGDEGEWRCLKKKAESIDLLECLVPFLVRGLYLKEKIEILIYGNPKDEGYQMSLILSKKTVQSLIDVAKRVAEKETVNKMLNMKTISITFPSAREGSIEQKVLQTMEVLFQQISQLMFQSSPSDKEIEAPGILRKNRNGLQKVVNKLIKRKRS